MAKRKIHPLRVGSATDGGPVLWDPVTAPHLLISGSTGTGKSCLTQNLMDEARLAAMDVVRLSPVEAYDAPRHARSGVFSDALDAMLHHAQQRSLKHPTLLVIDDYGALDALDKWPRVRRARTRIDQIIRDGEEAGIMVVIVARHKPAEASTLDQIDAVVKMGPTPRHGTFKLGGRRRQDFTADERDDNAGAFWP